MPAVTVLLSVARRSLLVPALVPVAFVVSVSSWASIWLALESMGATEAYLAEVRHGCLLFAGALALSLFEPLRTGDDARRGMLRLRWAHRGALGLVPRWLGLVLATLPVVILAALAAGGAPGDPLALLIQLHVLAAGGMALGAFLERGRLVPALWALLVLGHVRPWVAASDWGRPLAWLLPRLSEVGAGQAAWPALLWCVGALLIARARLSVVASGG